VNELLPKEQVSQFHEVQGFSLYKVVAVVKPKFGHDATLTLAVISQPGQLCKESWIKSSQSEQNQALHFGQEKGIAELDSKFCLQP